MNGYRRGVSKEWKSRAKAPKDFQASGILNPGSEAAAWAGGSHVAESETYSLDLSWILPA